MLDAMLPETLKAAITPMLIFIYLLFALFLISQFERNTRKELGKVKKHLRAIEQELGNILNPPQAQAEEQGQETTVDDRIQSNP